MKKAHPLKEVASVLQNSVIEAASIAFETKQDFLQAQQVMMQLQKKGDLIDVDVRESEQIISFKKAADRSKVLSVFKEF